MKYILTHCISFICVIFIFLASASAAPIETNWENNCNRIDTVDFWNGYTLKHSSATTSRLKNIGRTELYKDGILQESRNTVFYSNGFYIYAFRWSNCSVHSRLASAQFIDPSTIRVSYDYFNPKWNSSVTGSAYDRYPTYFSTAKKNITDISPRVYAFWTPSYYYVQLNLQDSSIATDGNISSPWFYNNIINLWGATPGTRLSSSKQYGVSGCEIDDVIQTDENYLVDYNCSVYHLKSASVIDGAEKRTTQVYTGVFTLPKSEYDLCSYNAEFCTPVPTPTNLTQSFIAPLTDIPQEINVGQNIGKFQSGSGVIFTADIDSDTPTDYDLEVLVLDRKNLQTVATERSKFQVDGKSKMTIQIPKWDYSWSASVIDITWNESDTIAFEDNGWEADFSIFEWFEPYPFAYRFDNSSPDYSILTWGIWSDPTDLSKRSKIDGTKWEIFELAFWDWISGVIPNRAYNAFEAFSFNKSSGIKIFDIWTCYGLVLSAILWNSESNILQDKSPGFLSELWNGTIFDSIDILNSAWSTTWDWDIYNDISRTILWLHLLQSSKEIRALDSNSSLSPIEILNTIKNNLDKTYILSFYGKIDDIDTAHAVVPFRVEENRIYIWDPNEPYSWDLGNESYEQYIEIDILNDSFVAKRYDKSISNIFRITWDEFTKMELLDSEEIIASIENPTPLGFNENDLLFTVSWSPFLTIRDQSWNVTGIINGETIEDIPWSQVLNLMNASLDKEKEENTWKQIYFPEWQGSLTVEVSWTTNESYDLLIAWWDYYTKLEWVSTSSGQVDTFTTTATNLQIDFDDSKTWDYNILVDNFQDSGTGTVYIDSVDIIPETQNLLIDWDKVIQNNDDAVTYETDLDDDGTFDTIVSVPAISIWEELIQEPELEIYYSFPNKNTSFKSWQSRKISSYYKFVKPRQPSGMFKTWFNIEMDVPPAGESYTAYIHIWDRTFSFTNTKDPEPISDYPTGTWTLDFGTKTVSYSWTVMSKWVQFPFLNQPTQFTLVWGWNPTVKTSDWIRSNTWTVMNGTNIQVDIPELWESITVEFEVVGRQWVFTINRQ